MLPFFYPIRPAPFPVLVIAERFSPRSIPVRTVDDSVPLLSSIDHRNEFSIRLNVDDFRPDELNISIGQDRLIVRGRHVDRTLTTGSILNEHEDPEPDYVAREFKRTYSLPSNVDIRQADAQFYPHQRLLMIQIPFQHSSEIRTDRRHLRPIDIILALVVILSVRNDEQFLNPRQVELDEISIDL